MGRMQNRKTKLNKLEYAVFRKAPPSLNLNGEPLGLNHKVIAAVSGGADSVAMLQVISKLAARWKFDLTVAYVHHGKSKNLTTNRYRNNSAKLVEQLASSLNLPFSALELASSFLGETEESMRDGRFDALERFAIESGSDVIALGHHADDLFETRLIRLLRGTGPQGLSSMRTISKTSEGTFLWRPLLDFQRIEIEAYLVELGFRKNKEWLVDPSNADARYLRNAVRKKLIPLIEQLRPGGAQSMARSLGLLADFVEESGRAETLAFRDITHVAELDRKSLLAMGEYQRRECLANWVLAQGLRNFSKRHVLEILKRIDTPEKSLSFKSCGRVWLVDSKIRLVAVQG
jgi:tRNA(Ile)-lysidine synthase